MSLNLAVATLSVRQLSTRKRTFYQREIRRVYQRILAELALTLTALAGKDMAAICLLTLQLTGTGHLEALLCCR